MFSFITLNHRKPQKLHFSIYRAECDLNFFTCVRKIFLGCVIHWDRFFLQLTWVKSWHVTRNSFQTFFQWSLYGFYHGRAGGFPGWFSPWHPPSISRYLLWKTSHLVISISSPLVGDFSYQFSLLACIPRNDTDHPGGTSTLKLLKVIGENRLTNLQSVAKLFGLEKICIIKHWPGLEAKWPQVRCAAVCVVTLEFRLNANRSNLGKRSRWCPHWNPGMSRMNFWAENWLAILRWRRSTLHYGTGW